MSLKDEERALLDAHLDDPEALQTAVFALCWPSPSLLADDLRLPMGAEEDLDAAARRLRLSWNPMWLVEAGYGPGLPTLREQGVYAHMTWDPAPEPCRVDDQRADNINKGSTGYRKRIAGEVALLALWTESAARHRIDLSTRDTKLNGGTRGSRFKDIIVHCLRKQLPSDWRVEPEVKLSSIRGLHMRQNLTNRKSDIVVIDEGRRLVAVISSKWTWRSDRGTEAAQMVPLTRHRPDIPYALVTAEFPRAKTVARESIEDMSYHLCPDWVGSWLAIESLPDGEQPRDRWPTLRDLAEEGRIMATMLGLSGMDGLVKDLKASGEIL